jgi:alpha-beta hydrolase superfamily lysophospholipase
MLYGAKDEIIPEGSVKRAAKRLPAHVETAYYPNGYHMLLSDLQGERVWNDILTFIRAPTTARPSQARPLPWIERRDIAGSVQAAR